jgi:hypothetical protein
LKNEYENLKTSEAGVKADLAKVKAEFEMLNGKLDQSQKLNETLEKTNLLNLYNFRQNVFSKKVFFIFMHAF